MWRKNLDTTQTIFALTSGSLPSAVAIEKLSGPEAFSIANRLFTPFHGEQFERKRGMAFGTLVDRDGRMVDEVVALSFVAPHSHTGEDTVEFHCHGSRPIVQRVEELFLELGARPAERGEFSYRALLNGKMSAADVERLGDVFLARAPVDLDRIYSRRDGSLVAEIATLRAELIRLQAVLDTAVDFSEEYSSVVTQSKQPLEAVIRGCSAITHRYSSFKTGAQVPRLVLAGRPNAGKSSLFNALLCRYRAIVHAEPGTTRDVIEEDIEIEGARWKLVDTAGIRATEASAEKEGIALGEDFLSSSAFWVLVVDGTEGLSSAEEGLLEKFGDRPHLIVWNKADLPNWQEPPAPLSAKTLVKASAVTGESVAELWNVLKAKLGEILPPDAGPLPTAVQAARLDSIARELKALQSELEAEVPPEVLAERNRLILERLGGTIGDVSTEDILDRVFSDFCIGK